MKPSASIDEIVEFDGDTFWESVCYHFQVDNFYISDSEPRAYPLDDLYLITLICKDGTEMSRWMPNSELYGIYDSYLARLDFIEEIRRFSA